MGNLVQFPNRMTFVRDEDGAMVEQKKKPHIVVQVANAVLDAIRIYSELINGLIMFAIKLGILVWLYPYITKAIYAFWKAISVIDPTLVR